MPTLPTADDVNKAREQATKTIGGAVEQARTPFMAALGAGDLAANAVVDTLSKVRAQINARTESARAGVQELPTNLTELRSKLDPSELRKVADTYTQSARDYYGKLANRGEDALGRLREQPQVQRAWSQVENVQGRVETAVEDARGFADDVLGRVTRRTRSVGEKAAQATEKAAGSAAETVTETADAVKSTAGETAETIKETGEKAASATRSTARKAASKTASAKSSTTTKPSTNGKASES